MSYRDTARAFVAAERHDAEAAERLPVSEWSQVRRDLLSPQTVAANHALHVSGWAGELREAVEEFATAGPEDTARAEIEQRVIDAGRELLRAIGEEAGE